MAVTSNRERALQVVLVVLGLLTVVTNISALVTSLLALRPTGGTTAPMFYTIFGGARRFPGARGAQPLRVSQLDRVRRMVQFRAYGCHGADGDATSHQTRRAAGRRGSDRPAGRAAVRARAVLSPF